MFADTCSQFLLKMKRGVKRRPFRRSRARSRSPEYLEQRLRRKQCLKFEKALAYRLAFDRGQTQASSPTEMPLPTIRRQKKRDPGVRMLK